MKGRLRRLSCSGAEYVQEIMLTKGATINMMFVDWQKAFDAVDHDKLFEALDRLGIPHKFIRVIKNFYEHARFSAIGDPPIPPSETGKQGPRRDAR